MGRIYPIIEQENVSGSEVRLPRVDNTIWFFNKDNDNKLSSKDINGNIKVIGDITNESVTLSNLTVTGETNVGVISATTMISGSTNLNEIFEYKGSGDITRVQNGLNTYTGGTENEPNINISSVTLHNLSVSGETGVNIISATTMIFGGYIVERDSNGNITSTTFDSGRKIDIIRDIDGVITKWEDNNYEWSIGRDVDGNFSGMTIINK